MAARNFRRSAFLDDSSSSNDTSPTKEQQLPTKDHDDLPNPSNVNTFSFLRQRGNDANNNDDGGDDEKNEEALPPTPAAVDEETNNNNDDDDDNELSGASSTNRQRHRRRRRRRRHHHHDNDNDDNNTIGRSDNHRPLLAPAPLDSFIAHYHPQVKHDIHTLYTKRAAAAHAAMSRLQVMAHKRQTMREYLVHAQMHLEKKRESVLSEARVSLDRLHSELEEHYDRMARRLDEQKYHMSQSLQQRIDALQTQQDEILRTHATLSRRVRNAVQTQLIHSFPDIMRTIDELTVKGDSAEDQWQAHTAMVNDDYLERHGFHAHEIDALRITTAPSLSSSSFRHNGLGGAAGLPVSSHEYLLEKMLRSSQDREKVAAAAAAAAAVVGPTKQKRTDKKPSNSSSSSRKTVRIAGGDDNGSPFKSAYDEMERLYTWSKQHPPPIGH